MRVQKEKKKRRYMIWGPVFLVPVLLALLMPAACFQFDVPDRAQILCDEDNDLCPAGWVCCGGRCEEGHCLCEHGRCNTEYAVDCQAGRVCSGGCWEDCPECFDDCADRSLKNCSLDKVQGIWFCRKSETCMLREDLHAGQIADCLTPPPTCTGLNGAKCECLAAPAAFYPPCRREEKCQNRSTQCVACVQQQADEGGTARYIDAGLDSQYDAQHDGLDASVGGGPGGADGADVDAGISYSLDAAGSSQAEMVPDCFRGIGTSSAGKTCCDVYAESAQMVNGQWECPEDSIFAPQCDGFSQGCMSDEAPNCHSDESCYWQLASDDGLMHCMGFGPAAAPCLNQQWQCYCGTVLSSECDVFDD